MVSTIALDLDDRTVARLRTVCSARNRQPLELVRQAVAEFLDREEGLAEDAARWQGYDPASATIDNDIGAERLDRLGARGRRTATLVANAHPELGDPDEDTARDAAKRAFWALRQQD